MDNKEDMDIFYLLFGVIEKQTYKWKLLADYKNVDICIRHHLSLVS